MNRTVVHLHNLTFIFGGVASVDPGGRRMLSAIAIYPPSILRPLRRRYK